MEKGYRQTEIGVIPENWKIMSIEEIFNFYSTSNYSKAQMYADGEIGCIHYGLIHAIPNNTYDVKDGIKYYVTKEQAKYELIRNGDVVMVDASEDLEGINKSVEIQGITNIKLIAGLHTFLLRDTKSILTEGFRGAILNSATIKNQFLRLAVGMKVFGVSKPQLKSVLIPIPPLAEQTAIAAALSDMDALIAQTERRIAKKKAIQQGVMQELLRPKEGWVNKKLGDIVSIMKSGGTPLTSQREFYDGNIPFLSIGDMTSQGKYLNYTDTSISSQGLEKSASWIVPKNSLIYSMYASVGLVAINKIDLAISQAVLGIKFIEDINLDFMYYKLLSMQTSVLKFVGEGTQKNLNARTVKGFDIQFPSYQQQTEIATILNEIDSNIFILQTKLQKLKLQKQGMLQALLTGKIRLA